MNLLAGSLLVLMLAFSGCATVAVDMSRARFDPVATGSEASLRGLCVVSDEVIWASGTGATVLRSIDGGQHWSNVHPAGEIDFRDIHAFDAQTAFVMGITEPACIEQTTDGGQTWTTVHTAVDATAFFDSITFVDRQNAYLFGDPVEGVFTVLRSSDGGSTWLQASAQGLPVAQAGEAGFAASGTCIAAVGPRHAWIGTGGDASRVLRSNDGGSTWQAFATPMGSAAAASSTQGIYSIAFRDEHHGVIVGGDYSKEASTARTAATSEDGGRTWRAARSLPHGYRSGVAFVPGRAGACVAVGSAGADYSEDGGQTWHTLGDQGFHTVGFSPSGLGWAAGSDGRIARLIYDGAPSRP